MTIHADLALARQLERTEATISAGFVEVHARSTPERRTTWHDFTGTWAMFDGVGSPMTQTFGLGLDGPVTASLLGDLERFFADRGADTDHEVCPLAGVAALALLVERGYLPHELSSVLVLDLGDAAWTSSAAALVSRQCEGRDRVRWIDAAVAGWAPPPGAEELTRDLATAAFDNPALIAVVVELDGGFVATGALGIVDGVCLLAGASTLPSQRGRGGQTSLLAHRLTLAREQGCSLAMVVTEPGSASQRNAERNGFQVAYTRTKWRRGSGR